MIIVYITQYLPYPTTGGGKIKTFSTLSALQKLGHQIILYSFITDKKDISYEDYLIKKGLTIGKTIYNSCITDKLPINYKFFLFLRSLFSLKPFTVSKYYKKEMSTAIKEILSS